MRTKAMTATTLLAGCLTLLGPPAPAQQASPITALSLGPDKIGVVRSAPEITTRISFTEQVKEIICGDLYDSSTGKGGFVVQRSDRDVFLKPVATRGISNLFVKTGENAEHIYNFDLEIVPAALAYRVVNVTGAESNESHQQSPQTAAKQQGDEILNVAHKQADEITLKANQQSDNLIKQAREQAAELEKQAVVRAGEEIDLAFAKAVLAGIQEVKTRGAQSASSKVVVTLDRRMLTFNGKSYLQYTIQNNSGADFVYSAISLEATLGTETKSVPSNVVQSKAENKVEKGETVPGVVIFDSSVLANKGKLSLSVRGDDNAVITRVSVLR